jgi:hypothetical protein
MVVLAVLPMGGMECRSSNEGTDDGEEVTTGGSTGLRFRPRCFLFLLSRPGAVAGSLGLEEETGDWESADAAVVLDGTRLLAADATGALTRDDAAVGDALDRSTFD